MTYGNFWLILCCVSYEVWWSIAFHPVKKVPFAPKLILFFITLALGIAGVSLMIGAIASVPDVMPLPIWGIVLVAIGAYVVLLLVSSRLFHRQVTTELFLIVGWAVLVFLEVNALYGLGIVPRNGAVILFAAAVIVALVSMVCYVLYYGLDDRAGYVDGMIPLLLAGAFMAVLAVLIARSGR